MSKIVSVTSRKATRAEKLAYDEKVQAGITATGLVGVSGQVMFDDTQGAWSSTLNIPEQQARALFDYSQARGYSLLPDAMARKILTSWVILNHELAAVHLTPLERRILERLIPLYALVSKERVLEAGWAKESDRASRVGSLHVYINRLRKKLRLYDFEIIVTRKSGYMLVRKSAWGAEWNDEPEDLEPLFLSKG